MPTKWDTTLEKALLVELLNTWILLNKELFRGSMRQPALQLHNSEQKLGYWHGPTRTLSMSRPWVIRTSWGQVVEVIKHEMAHQFVSEVLLETEQSPHGPAFKKVCARFHIDSRAVGTPLNGATEAKTVDRIQKLLALAKSPNEHEAQVALNKARRLMAEHANAWEKREHAPNFQFRQVGPAKGRFDPWEKCLAGLLARHFFVLAIWVPVYNVLRGKTVRILEINGRCDALEVAEYAHAFLTHTAETLWKNHRQAKGLQSNKDRRTFLLGVMMGFTQSLEAEEVRCEEAGLVPRQDDELDHWFRKRHRHIRTRRGGTIRQTEALQAGQAVGRNIQLRQALTKRRGLLRRLLG